MIPLRKRKREGFPSFAAIIGVIVFGTLFAASLRFAQHVEARPPEGVWYKGTFVINGETFTRFLDNTGNRNNTCYFAKREGEYWPGTSQHTSSVFALSCVAEPREPE